LAVPRIADWCAVYLREPNGFFRPATIHHSDPAKVQLANELIRRYPFSVATERRLIETRAPLFMPSISPEMIQAGAIDARHAAILQQLDIASAIVVPLLVDDDVTGMLHIVHGHASEAFTASDVDFTQVLANRIAVAIDNVAVYERARNVATTFQNAALPRRLPQIDGVALHHAYRTGDGAAAVGGDWYDAVPLPDGSLLFSIGDVAGKGLEAAVLMAAMRQAIRVAGLQGLAPGAVLEAANAALRAEESGRFVTAFVGRLNLASGELLYASAGHPMPLIRQSGIVRTLRFGDPPLGVWDGAFETSSIVLQPPWLLIAHTDGLIERTGDIVAGEALLRQVIADDGIAHATNPAAYLQARLLPDRVRDDTAILSVRVDGPHHWRFGAEDALQAETARHGLTAWLAERTRVETCAAEIICGELIGNVVRHAPGPIDIDVAHAGGRARIFVQSSGDPFTLRALLPQSIFSENGRGLFLIDSLGTDLRADALPVFGNQVSVDLPLNATTGS
jgi:anti-sigma regulatory factor (Ser/Thr protein kinase)